MNQTRREFAAMLGAVAFPSVWERAEAEYEQTGEVSPDIVQTLLDIQGERGIFADPKHLEELRAAVGRKIRDHKLIRAVKLPEDIQPVTFFKR